LSGETEFLIASIELWHLIPRNPNLWENLSHFDYLL
jgi:hypothetical protein